jgi:hypothetical protein
MFPFGKMGVTLYFGLYDKKAKKKKSCPCTSGGIALSFFNLALDGGAWSASRPARFNPGENNPIAHRRLSGPHNVVG